MRVSHSQQRHSMREEFQRMQPDSDGDLGWSQKMCQIIEKFEISKNIQDLHWFCLAPIHINSPDIGFMYHIVGWTFSFQLSDGAWNMVPNAWLLSWVDRRPYIR